MKQPPTLPTVRAGQQLDPEVHRYSLVQRLRRYVPSAIDPGIWDRWRDRAMAFVLECEPTNDTAAIGLARALAELIANTSPADENPWSAVLSARSIASHLGRLKATHSPATVQQRRSQLTKAQKVALGLPRVSDTRSDGIQSDPFSDEELRRFWERSYEAPDRVGEMLRYRLALEVTTGRTPDENPTVDLRLLDGLVTAADPSGEVVYVAPPCAALIGRLVNEIPRPRRYDQERVKSWLTSAGLQIGRNRGRDTFLVATWSQDCPTADLLLTSRATYRDIERVSSALPMPEADSIARMLRGTSRGPPPAGDPTIVDHRETAE